MLLHFGLDEVKNYKLKNVFFFYSPPQVCHQKQSKHAIRLIYSKSQLIETNWKSENFRVIRLVVPQQLRKLTAVEGWVHSFYS